MNYVDNNKLIDPEKYQVFVFCCPAHVPLNFAIHPWLVCNEKGKVSRWEVLFRENTDKKWGFLHENRYPPFEGIEIFNFSKKWLWKSRLLKSIEGDDAKKMIEFIEASKENYPYLHKYSSNGTNSNTYVQWVLNNFPEFEMKLPWNAIGKNAK